MTPQPHPRDTALVCDRVRKGQVAGCFLRNPDDTLGPGRWMQLPQGAPSSPRPRTQPRPVTHACFLAGVFAVKSLFHCVTDTTSSTSNLTPNPAPSGGGLCLSPRVPGTPQSTLYASFLRRFPYPPGRQHSSGHGQGPGQMPLAYVALGQEHPCSSPSFLSMT